MASSPTTLSKSAPSQRETTTHPADRAPSTIPTTSATPIKGFSGRSSYTWMTDALGRVSSSRLARMPRCDCRVRNECVQGIKRSCTSGFGSRRCHVSLRGGHGFVAEQLHQGVYADVGAGEFGGVGVAQSVYQGAGDGLGVGAGALERPFNARLQSS